MAKKSKAQKLAAQEKRNDDQPVPNIPLSAGYFPFAGYTSVVGVHTTLLGFSVLFLPRTTGVFEFLRPEIDLTQITSKDRPQHPFLDALTLSPVFTLACICAGATVLQSWWGGWVRAWWIDYALQGAELERRIDRLRIDERKFIHLRNAWLATAAASVFFHVVLILFGAPLLSHVWQTYLLALLLSVLVVFPPAYTIGSPSDSLMSWMTWVRLFAEFSVRSPVERAMLYPAVGTIVGCWLGVIPIALDWDRPWQVVVDPIVPRYILLKCIAGMAVDAGAGRCRWIHTGLHRCSDGQCCQIFRRRAHTLAAYSKSKNQLGYCTINISVIISLYPLHGHEEPRICLLFRVCLPPPRRRLKPPPLALTRSVSLTSTTQTEVLRGNEERCARTGRGARVVEWAWGAGACKIPPRTLAHHAFGQRAAPPMYILPSSPYSGTARFTRNDSAPCPSSQARRSTSWHEVRLQLSLSLFHLSWRLRRRLPSAQMRVHASFSNAPPPPRARALSRIARRRHGPRAATARTASGEVVVYGPSQWVARAQRSSQRATQSRCAQERLRMLARAREGECAEQTHVRGRTDESARADCADQAGAVCGTWCHKRRLERSAPTRRRRSLAQTRRRRDAAPLRPPLARGGEVVDGARPSVHGLGVVACECVRRTASEPSRAHAHLPRSTAGSRCAQVRCSTRALGGAERRRGVDAANGSARAGQMPLLARAKNGVGKPLALLVFFVLFVTNYAGSLNISISPSRLDAVSGSSYSEDGAASQLGGDDDLGQ